MSDLKEGISNSPGSARASRRNLLSGAAITTGLTLLNILIGVGFQALLAARLGDSRAADVYAAGTGLPTVLATAIIGSVPLVFVPYLARMRARNESTFPVRALRGAGVSLLLITLACWLGAPLLAHAVAPGFSGHKLAETTTFLEITSPVSLLSAASALGQAFAYSDRRYVRGGAGAAVNGVGLLAGVLVLGVGHPSVTELAVSVLLGYCLQAAWFVPELWGSRHMWARIPTGAEHRTFTWTLFTLTAGSVIFKGQPVIERTIATSVGPGSAAIMSYALKIATGLVAFSGGLQTVTMPAFSHSLSNKDGAGAAANLALVMTIALMISGAIAAYVGLAGPEIIRVLYGRGDLTITSEHKIAAVTVGYLLFVVTGSMSGPMANVFYARQRQRWVAWIAFVGFLVGAGFCFVLSRVVGLVGVSIGTGIGFVVPLLVFANRLKGELPDWTWTPWLRANSRMAVMIAVAFGLALLASELLVPHLPARRHYPALIGDLLIKGGFLVIAMSLLAAILHWDPRDLLKMETDALQPSKPPE